MVFLCFQGAQKEIRGMKWVKRQKLKIRKKLEAFGQFDQKLSEK